MKRRSILKIAVTLILVIMVLLSSNFVYANTDSEISTNAYYGGITTTFNGSKQISNQYYDGLFMAVEAKATASDNQSHKITLSVRIVNRDTVKNYTLYTNGQNYKFDYISLGLSGGSNAVISCTCDDPSVAVTINLTTYSW